MPKIAILYICTGSYGVLWKDFFISSEKYFLPECEKHYFVFTNLEEIYNEKNCPRIHKTFQKHLGWPENTLKRFHIFLSQETLLKEFDFMFFLNANCLFVDYVYEKEFLPQKELLMVSQPGFFNKSNLEFTYDRNPKSTAYIEYGLGRHYVTGGINGGKTQEFLRLCRILKNNIDIDESNNEMALWHDESHLNKYIVDRNDYCILSPSYFYPEGWDHLPFAAKILVRNKDKYFDVKTFKEKSQRKTLFSKIKKLFHLKRSGSCSL